MDKANGEEARQRWRRAQWTKTDRKTGSPSLIPEGEETNSVCRENEERVRQSLEEKKEVKRQQIHYQK